MFHAYVVIDVVVAVAVTVAVTVDRYDVRRAIVPGDVLGWEPMPVGSGCSEEGGETQNL